MFDLVEHLPIKSQDEKVAALRQQVLENLLGRAKKLDYEIAGEVRFRVIELPLSQYVECRMPVVPVVRGRG